MAPELALDKIQLLTEPGDTVLDPMCGSGTVVRVAVDENRKGIGADLDPLAVIITRATCMPDWSTDLHMRAEDVVRNAKRRSSALPSWIASDPATAAFVEYWFGPEQTPDLARLARVLADRPRRDDALRIALSRLIVTKESAASLARDTAHSRPHRVRLSNDFDVFDGYLRAAERLESLAMPAGGTPGGAPRASIRRADARRLHHVDTASVDLVVTSPPYLNAIDYLRGHRLSLVWLGWTVGELRELRGSTIGAERGLPSETENIRKLASNAVPRFAELTGRQQGMVIRFARDMDQLCATLGRVVKPGGHAVFVVADSQLGGITIENSSVCSVAARSHGFEMLKRQRRPIPAHHRYLPPPSNDGGALSQRMREEIIYTFIRTTT
jgi:hypothetical protein